ncbi:MAG: hypothetical protein MZV63_12350 [Marinilabiliales bacterium]|nr:hypothetical protein [Marinilabiliales bacterium]
MSHLLSEKVYSSLFLYLKTLQRSDNRIDLRQISNFPDPCKIIPYLLFLELKLKVIRKMLPFASAANSEMPATWLYPVGRIFMEPDHTVLPVYFFSFS